MKKETRYWMRVRLSFPRGARHAGPPRRWVDWHRKAADPAPGDGLRFLLWLALVAAIAVAAILGA